jgi:hypothetical protein
MNEWISFAVAWLPFVMLIAVWFWFARRNGMQARGSSVMLIAVWFWFARRNGMQAKGSSGSTMIELYEQQVAETRRMNGFLERIAASLEKREK